MPAFSTPGKDQRRKTSSFKTFIHGTIHEFQDADSKVIRLKPQKMDGRVECLALEIVKVFLFGVPIFAHIIQLFSLRQLEWLVIWHITCCLNKKIYIQEGSNPETFALGDGCKKKKQPSGASRLHHILCPKFAGMDETWHPKCLSQRVGTHVGKGSPFRSLRPEDMTPLKLSSLQLSLVALEVAHFTHLPSIKQSGNENTREFQALKSSISEKSLAPHRHFSKMIMES